ncbi:MAG: sigma-70 family RNA polymerase sigma factor, partial [Acidobacteria bacterium]|nr:sigma-70 family RNA polymerase sigma factor [Acidobacteriota bacterium]
IPNFPLSEDAGAFYGVQTEGSRQGAKIKNAQIIPLKKQKKGFNTKRGQNANFTSDEFEKIILSNISFLKSAARKMTNQPEDAEDLLQETLMRAYRFFSKFEKGTHPKAWLYRIMKNTNINNYRKSLREIDTNSSENVELKSGGALYQSFKKIQDPNKALSNKYLMEEIRNVIKKLPEDFRDTLVLCLVDGYSYKEVAEKMNCPIGTIMSRIHRARKILQKELENHFETFPEPQYEIYEETFESEEPAPDAVGY